MATNNMLHNIQTDAIFTSLHGPSMHMLILKSMFIKTMHATYQYPSMKGCSSHTWMELHTMWTIIFGANQHAVSVWILHNMLLIAMGGPAL